MNYSWTTDLPTEAGYYWHRERDGKRWRLYKVDGMPYGILYVPDVTSPETGGAMTVHEVGGEWAGPIPPPSRL